MKGIRTIIAAFFVILLLGANTASAFSVPLTYTNVSGLPPNTTYATVNGTVDAADHSIFHFDINLAAGLKTLLNGGKNFGMDQFFFNSNLILNNSMFTNLNPATWQININYGNLAADGFGKFDIKLDPKGRNIRTSHLLFDVDYTSAVTESNFIILSADPSGNGNGHFAAHIGGFNYNNEGSTFVRDKESPPPPPIPEPGTMILLGISLLTAAGFMRKMQK